jgi:hypothetical protein
MHCSCLATNNLGIPHTPNKSSRMSVIFKAKHDYTGNIRLIEGCVYKVVLSSEVKRRRCEINLSLPSKTEIKNAWSYTPTPTHVLKSKRDKFTFTFTFVLYVMFIFLD